MAGELNGRKIAFLATDGVEAVELSEPRRAVEEAGAEVHLLSIKDGEIQGVNHMDKGPTFKVDRLVSEANVEEYDGLVLPGGVANPDFLRMDRSAVSFARDFMRADKPVAAICHGPWLLVETGCVNGRVLTSWPSLQTDIRNAGGAWVDEEVHVDKNLVTSRNPDDIPAFNKRVIEAFAPALEAKPTEDTIMPHQDLDEAVEQTFPASDPVPTPTKA